MEKRTYGGTGHRSTIITLGGAIFMHPISRKEEEDFMKLGSWFIFGKKSESGTW